MHRLHLVRGTVWTHTSRCICVFAAWRRSVIAMGFIYTHSSSTVHIFTSFFFLSLVVLKCMTVIMANLGYHKMKSASVSCFQCCLSWFYYRRSANHCKCCSEHVMLLLLFLQRDQEKSCLNDVTEVGTIRKIGFVIVLLLALGTLLPLWDGLVEDMNPPLF